MCIGRKEKRKKRIGRLCVLFTSCLQRIHALSQRVPFFFFSQRNLFPPFFRFVARRRWPRRRSTGPGRRRRATASPLGKLCVKHPCLVLVRLLTPMLIQGKNSRIAQLSSPQPRAIAPQVHCMRSFIFVCHLFPLGWLDSAPMNCPTNRARPPARPPARPAASARCPKWTPTCGRRCPSAS